ncbi:MAG: hypothetical protein RBR08_02735 [Desulforegulaceae bacterium]|nr:hypothetical protein [Desulforegulaceae bacterium]
MNAIFDKFVFRQYKKIRNYLTYSDPEKIISDSEKKLIKAFKTTSKTLPFYKKFLLENRIDPDLIDSMESFKKNIPLIDKETVFSKNSFSDFCKNGSLQDISLVYSSSGSSNVFSFGVETWKNRKRSALGIEFLLDNAFDIFKKKTFLINCLPMGVKIFTRTLPVAETSVREDVVVAVLDKLKNYYDQFIIVGESLFLKKVVEEGIKKGIPLRDMKINIITGGEFISETYRSYMASLLNIDLLDPETGIIAFNMGLSEISMSIFSENISLIKLRNKALSDEKLRNLLFGDCLFIPLFMQYIPLQNWLETTDKNSELVVSVLDENSKIPLIRYNTKDIVKLVSYEKMKENLCSIGYEEFLPEFKLPFGIITGKNLSVDNGAISIHVNQVKEALYYNFELASRLTGNFKLIKHDDKVLINLQLKKNYKYLKEDENSFLTFFDSDKRKNLEVKFWEFFSFGHGIDHDFERKNIYT